MLSKLSVSASAQLYFKLLTVSRSPPTPAASDSRGAKHVRQSQQPMFVPLSMVAHDRSACMTVLANEMTNSVGGPARGHVDWLPLFCRVSGRQMHETQFDT